MKRDLPALADTTFDLLVIGGGVLGAWVARDAALRGLSVALVEKGDFGGGTSWNSLKIIHGGLRYLQHLDLLRMRDSIRERKTWLRLAPHLVEPLPILVPTYGYGLRSRSLLRAALAVNDLVAGDRNRALLPERHLPAGRGVSRSECLDMVPEIATAGLTGGVLFHDAVMYSSERLVLEILDAAHQSGAVLANYIECEAPLRSREGLIGAQLRDHNADERIPVRARVIVNASGPAAPHLAARLTERPGAFDARFSVALNLMAPDLGHRVAFAVTGASRDATAVVSRGGRQLFFVPWRGRSILGTAHYPFDGDPATFRPQERHVSTFLREVNDAWPGQPIAPDSIVVVHGGLLPVEAGHTGDEVRLLKHPLIRDHAADGIPGLVSAVSVKFTTGRSVAQRIVDLACRKLGRADLKCRTDSEPLPGARFASLAGLQAAVRRRLGARVDEEAALHLMRTYGARLEQVLGRTLTDDDWNRRVVPDAPVLRAQFMHGARHEMALRAEDLVQRRSELGARGLATEAALRCAAEVLAQEHQAGALADQSSPDPR